MKTRLCLFYFLFPLFCYPASGSLPTGFYFWVGPDPLPGTGDPVNPQGFVVRVSQARGLQVESMLEQGISVGVATRIAAGQVKYNKNCYSPDQPVWNWHVVSVQVFDKATVSFPASILPYLDSKPSDIDANPAQ